MECGCSGANHWRDCCRQRIKSPETVLDFSHLVHAKSEAGAIIEEVEEVVDLPQFDSEAVRRVKERQSVTLPPEVMPQLRDFVTVISHMRKSSDLTFCRGRSLLSRQNDRVYPPR